MATADRRVRIAVMNDFDIIVRGLGDMLSRYDDLQIVDLLVGEHEFDHAVDVALYDSYGRQGMPWDELAAVVADPRAAHVAVFTFAFSDELVQRALDIGVHGYLWKGSSADELAAALRRVAAGETVVHGPSQTQHGEDGYRWPFDLSGLSVRESEVLALLAEGLTNREIAEALYIGRETVKTHVAEVLRKLRVRSRTEAAGLALRHEAFARRLRQLQARAESVQSRSAGD
jgi:DNA-binding NarL/FixJ family response regulator